MAGNVARQFGDPPSRPHEGTLGRTLLGDGGFFIFLLQDSLVRPTRLRHSAIALKPSTPRVHI